MRSERRLIESNKADEILRGIFVLIELLEAGPLVHEFVDKVVRDPDLFENKIELGTLGDVE